MGYIINPGNNDIYIHIYKETRQRTIFPYSLLTTSKQRLQELLGFTNYSCLILPNINLPVIGFTGNPKGPKNLHSVYLGP